MVKIAASLHSGPKLHMSEILDQLKKADVDLLHIDVMDSIFVPEIDFGSNFTKEISQYTDIPLDIHMMVNNPSRLINEYALSTTTDIGGRNSSRGSKSDSSVGGKYGEARS